MFLHIFIYRFKCLIRDKQTIIWVFLFPILLATMFKLAIPDASATDNFKPINIAVINNDSYQNDLTFKSAISSVTNKEDNTQNSIMFNVQFVNDQEADKLLEEDKIIGYIVDDKEPNVVVKDSGYSQTILKEFISNYLQVKSEFSNIINENPNSISKLMSEGATNNTSYLKEVNPTSKSDNTNNSVTYYYALIAMACLYGGFLGAKEVNNVQADQSAQGARVNLAPTHKLKLFGYSIGAAITLQILITMSLLAYLKFALKIDFGVQTLYVILAGIASSFIGVSYGAAAGAIVKGKEGLKIAVIIGLTMLLSFLAGLMWGDMKYVITTAFPISAYINPANLIADSFYSLYYYDTYTRYFINIWLLFGFSIIFNLIVFFIMRRQKYASI